MSNRNRLVVGAALLCAAALTVPRAAAAAPVAGAPRLRPSAPAGIVTGTVTDAASHQPVAAAQVIVVGTGIGAVTDAQGHYRLVGVPAGSVRIRARRIGYGSTDQTVAVRDNESATVDFALTGATLALDAVVVTGTAGGTQMRAIGNTVDKLDVAKSIETSPAVNVQQLLGQKSAGVMILPNPGLVGSGSAVRIRGAASLSLTNQPILYVDGVRVDNNPAGGPAIRNGRYASRMNDFNPEDIESMEIIKGPAAATLYGTEASNGVIQIITKRGRSGKPRFDITLKEGGNFLPNVEGRIPYSYGISSVSGQRDSINMITRWREQTGRDIFTTGALHQVNASLGGGTDQARYFVSADQLNNTGIVDYNWVKATTSRANLSLLPAAAWQVDTHLDFIQNETRFAQAAEGFGIWDMITYSKPTLLSGPTKGFRYANPDVAGLIDSRSRVNRFTGGIDIRNTPFAWLTHQLKAGVDHGGTTNQILFPRVPDGQVNFFGSKGTGEKTLENVTTNYSTLDYSATAKTDNTVVTTATSFGAQYYRKQFTLASEYGQNFPTTDITTIGGAATTSSGEDYVENKTLGMYVQEAVGWRNRVFLTAALRGDANSAFGKDYKAAYYPKLSGAWVVSEEPFWRIGSVNSLRLRAAWGQAGQQPDAFDAITLYTPTTGPGGNPVLTPGSLGNPALRPERGEELEAGFDLGLLDDRITATFTHYNRITKDAIVRAPNQPSVGFPGVRVVNLGRVSASGLEIGVNARVLEMPRFGWDLGVNFATAHNTIESLGGLPPIGIVNSGNAIDQYNREGYSVGSFFWKRVVSANYSSSGALQNVLCDDGAGGTVACASAPLVYYGQPTPTRLGSVTNTFTLFKHLQLSALTDFQTGMTYEDGSIEANHQNFQNTAMANPVSGPVDPVFAAYQGSVGRPPLGFFDAGFAKLRELSASYTLPPAMAARFGATNASLTGAWRNVAILWRAQDSIYGTQIFDPEQRPPGAETAARFQTTIPPSSQVVLTVRLGF
ncbi:MAG: TonB-dependent outer membrane protein SusC/RagA [Gemmatimonadetes bacterium]|jgi:TonB-linked SusC/RagA family outer membrane protein|nr:TonB-dependent outer membrane protein SusC/RagA [Gemmatimonadota bacterium]